MKKGTDFKPFHLTTAEKNERQTKLSWATPITAYAEVPDTYKFFFQPMQQAGREFPGAVVTPTYAGFLNLEPEKLLCAVDEKLYILKKSETAYEICCLPFQDITWIEYQSVLLDSRLWFSANDQNHAPVREELHFNTISDYLFLPYIQRVRKFNFREDATIDWSFLDPLKEQSIKFTNFCRHSVLPGEKVLHLIWQPEPQKRFFKRAQPFPSAAFPSHVVMLTNHEIILIQESEAQTRNDTYGGAWTFLPLAQVHSVSILEQPHDWLHLEIILTDGTKFLSPFSSAHAMELEKLTKQFSGLQMK